jgi:hypothetical protein
MTAPPINKGAQADRLDKAAANTAPVKTKD